MALSNSLKAVLLVSLGVLLLYPKSSGTFTKEVTQEMSVQKDRIEVREVETAKPDGTKVVERVVIQERAKENSKTVETVVSKQAELSQYRLGVDYVWSFRETPKEDLRFKAGARIGRSPFWIESSVSRKDVTVGISVEW